MGDEGKGRLIPELIRELQLATRSDAPVGMVIKVNGGANSGHTSGGLKLNLFPAGVVEASVPCLAIGAGVVADPHKFIWEAAYIEAHGHTVRQRLRIDERTMVSDLSHRLLDLAFEDYRVKVMGETKRGSTARGISPAYCDETAHFPLYFADFTRDRAAFDHKLRHRLLRACAVIQHTCGVSAADWDGFFDSLSTAEARANQFLIERGLFPPTAFDFQRFKGDRPFELNVEAILEAWWQAGQQLLPCIADVRALTIETLAAGHFVIGEFGQAFWLDKRHGFAPNVTASHTLPAEFFLSCGVPLQPAHVFGVCKAYDTKVGTHVFACQFPADHPLGLHLSRLEFGTTTGRQRMVGWFDAVEKGDAIRVGGCNDIVINKLDALSYQGDWQAPNPLRICTHYTLPDGTRLHHVPRAFATHATIQPHFIDLPGWHEDISTIRTFDNLPLNAKRYVATALAATLNVANHGLPTHAAQAPTLRYIGVGPDPDQLVRNIPPTPQLLKLAFPIPA